MGVGWATQAATENLLLVRGDSVIEVPEICLNHTIELVLADLLVGGIFLQPLPRLLPPGPGLERRFFEQQLLEIVCGIEVCLFRGRDEHRLDLFPLKGLKVDDGEELVLDEALPRMTESLIGIVLQRIPDGVEAEIRHRGVGDWEFGFCCLDNGAE